MRRSSDTRASNHFALPSANPRSQPSVGFQAFVSDAYIPVDRFPAPVPGLLRLLPSTEFVDAFRGIAMDGQSLAHYAGWIDILALWAVAGTAVTARYFRWV
jgi:hypothetical protein